MGPVEDRMGRLWQMGHGTRSVMGSCGMRVLLGDYYGYSGLLENGGMDGGERAARLALASTV